MTATEDMEAGQPEAAAAAEAEPFSATGLIIVEQPQDENEARKKWAMSFVILLGTISLLGDVRQTLAGRGDQPAVLVLELSTWLSFLLYLWAVYVARVLETDRRRHRCLGRRALLAVLASIVVAVAASVLVFTFVSKVVGMVIMYLVSLCVAGFFAWCLNDYLRTRDSGETAETSDPCLEEKPVTTTAPDESQEPLLQKKSSSIPNLAHEHNAGDLEASLLLSPGA